MTNNSFEAITVDVTEIENIQSLLFKTKYTYMYIILNNKHEYRRSRFPSI